MAVVPEFVAVKEDILPVPLVVPNPVLVLELVQETLALEGDTVKLIGGIFSPAHLIISEVAFKVGIGFMTMVAEASLVPQELVTLNLTV